MIGVCVNRVFGLVGAPRVGKDSVANFLTETRGFTQIAFADQIKEEFGISKADFEAAKIAGNIEGLRDQLWAFSADKKKDDPLYFIRKVVDKVRSINDNVIVTDIRTPEELTSFFDMNLPTHVALNRVYWVRGNYDDETDDKGFINGSKLKKDEVANCMAPSSKYDLRCLNNDKNGLYAFYQGLDRFFFAEDIEDTWKYSSSSFGYVRLYLDQFEIKERR